MDIQTKLDTELPVLPLPIFQSIKIADAVNKSGDKFSIFIGLNTEMVKQVKEYSLDKNDIELQKNTGDKARFGESSYEEWYTKRRTPFALMHDESGALAALAWLGPKPLAAKSPKFGKEKPYESQDKWHTISLRSYAPFRGKGVMKGFSNFVLDFYKKEFPDALLWAGIDSRNEAVVKLMLALGFKSKEDVSDPSAHWLIFVR